MPEMQEQFSAGAWKADIPQNEVGGAAAKMPEMQEHSSASAWKADIPQNEVGGAAAKMPEVQEQFPAGRLPAQRLRIRAGLHCASDISHRLRAAAMAGWHPAIKRSPQRSAPQTKDKETVMNYATTAALALALSLAAGTAFAADAPTKTLTPQQQRMKDCNVQATGKHGEERRALMSTCLKGKSSAAAATPKQAGSKAKSDASAGKR